VAADRREARPVSAWLRVEAAGPAHVDALLALFEASASPCFCRYWHFTGTKNEWLERCALRREESATELRAAVEAARPEGQGLVALPTTSDDVVGWMKLVARDHLPKLRALPVYRSLDLGDGARTFSVGCLLVRPDMRGKGIARALVAAAPTAARRWGAEALEAYPRRSSEPLHPEEVWQGPERVLVEEGFTLAHDSPAYPVYRRRLDSTPAGCWGASPKG
jgi:GNAT superfamily N-acetyltransferase